MSSNRVLLVGGDWGEKELGPFGGRFNFLPLGVNEALGHVGDSASEPPRAVICGSDVPAEARLRLGRACGREEGGRFVLTTSLHCVGTDWGSLSSKLFALGAARMNPTEPGPPRALELARALGCMPEIERLLAS